MMVYAAMRTRDFEDGSAEEVIALFFEADAAEEFVRPYEGCYVEPYLVDDPEHLGQIITGNRPWHVQLWPPETGEQDRAFLDEPDDRMDPMQPSLNGCFVGILSAGNAEDAIAAGWQEVNAKGLKAKPYRIVRARQFVDFSKYLQPAETPFTSSLMPSLDAKAEWGTGRINDAGVDEFDKVWHDAVVPDDPGATKEPGDDDEHDATDGEQSRTLWVDDGALWHHHWHGERQ